jgi:hypothetical protein
LWWLTRALGGRNALPSLKRQGSVAEGEQGREDRFLLITGFR